MPWIDQLQPDRPQKSLTVIFTGGPLDGRMSVLLFEGDTPPVEVAFPTQLLGPGEPDQKVPVVVYRILEVEKGVPPLRGLMAQAVFTREDEARPGLVYPVE